MEERGGAGSWEVVLAEGVDTIFGPPLEETGILHKEQSPAELRLCGVKMREQAQQ